VDEARAKKKKTIWKNPPYCWVNQQKEEEKEEKNKGGSKKNNRATAARGGLCGATAGVGARHCGEEGGRTGILNPLEGKQLGVGQKKKKKKKYNKVKKGGHRDAPILEVNYHEKTITVRKGV